MTADRKRYRVGYLLFLSGIIGNGLFYLFLVQNFGVFAVLISFTLWQVSLPLILILIVGLYIMIKYNNKD